MALSIWGLDTITSPLRSGHVESGDPDQTWSAVPFLVFLEVMLQCIALNIFLSHKEIENKLIWKKARLKTTVTNICSKGSTRMMEHLIVSHSTCICKNPGTEADVDEHVEVALRSMMFFASFIFSMSPNRDACFYFRASDKMKLKQQCGHESTKLKSKKLHLNTTMIPEFSRVRKTMLAHTHFLWDRSLWAECPAAKRTKKFHHAATEKNTYYFLPCDVVQVCCTTHKKVRTHVFHCVLLRSATTLPRSATIINTVKSMRTASLSFKMPAFAFLILTACCLRNRYWTFWPLHPDIAKKTKQDNQGALLAPGPMDPPQIARL